MTDDTLSPALTAWLARFTAEVAPQFTWRLNSKGYLRAMGNLYVGICPIQAYDLLANRTVFFDTRSVELDSDTDVVRIILAADRETQDSLYSPALRRALLAACGVEEVIHAPVI